jgi:glycosyltransferase involved in cell wall biosynthesis
MNSDIFISIIIPTYNRSYYLLQILEKLKKNFLNFKKFEIIICDSLSKDNTESKVNNFINNNMFLPIRYFKITKNIHSLKRNIGLKKAKGKYVIFLDDDCFPEENFVKDYFNLLSKNSDVIYCGTVKYPKGLLEKNFIKYRQSTHFIINKNDANPEVNLPASKIVTMNMASKKNIFIKNKILFNQNFNRYGFEDYEFGFRLISNKFKLVASNPVVYHYDKRLFSSYLNKIRFLGFESMKYLVKLNFAAAKENNFYKLESFILIKAFLNFSIFKNLLLLFQKICIFLDVRFVYFPFIYKLAIASAYLEGCFYRKKYNDTKHINNYWYK